MGKSMIDKLIVMVLGQQTPPTRIDLPEKDYLQLLLECRHNAVSVGHLEDGVFYFCHVPVYKARVA